MACVLKLFDSDGFTRCSSLWLFNPFEYPPVQFRSGILVGNACIHVSYYLFIRGRFVFVFSNQVFWSFVEILSFGFYLVNYVFVSYLAFDHSLVYSYPKMFLLFLQCNLECKSSFKTIFFGSYVGFVFVSFFAPGCRCRISILPWFFPSFKSCFFIFNSQWMLTHASIMFLPMQTDA